MSEDHDIREAALHAAIDAHHKLNTACLSIPRDVTLPSTFWTARSNFFAADPAKAIVAMATEFETYIRGAAPCPAPVTERGRAPDPPDVAQRLKG